MNETDNCIEIISVVLSGFESLDNVGQIFSSFRRVVLKDDK